MEEFFKKNCCIRGCHVYKEVWEAAVGEVLVYERDPENTSDRYAVAVKNEGTIIGNWCQKLSRMCLLFLQ